MTSEAAKPAAALAGQFLRFGIVGTVGFLVDGAILVLSMALLGTGPYLGRVVSYLGAATATWALNRTFTFRGRHHGPAHHQWARFIAVNAVGGAVNYATYAVLVMVSATVAAHPVLGVAAGSIAGLAFNFTGSRLLVFRRA
ncbi:GtrA family protein [Arenibaculum sp.]|jgi:putative flippase GtrA|uniref:GtrA family protein n=1 Tax=Arenibaculum sp. TaxID=2865862 RepID=UPI002E11FE86|nr:GtrA family protein [Arenibaculum sp.]